VLYQQTPALWQEDGSPHGFEWIDVSDTASSVLSYLRWADASHAIVVLNLTPLPRAHYRIGVPEGAEYRCVLSTDDPRWGGSGHGAPWSAYADDVPFHGRRHSVELTLPPLSVMILVPARLAAHDSLA
jgi:1,4-alpha-glucan branching enzyme